ncbi:DUF3667 domain-containing protein [Asaia sp. BMEF1]|uniref:DUF3667 domain-containing protein n=1 Tax=Asaia sp. BMEF1 TaxID=3155932 RepID=UPI003F673C53
MLARPVPRLAPLSESCLLRGSHLPKTVSQIVGKRYGSEMKKYDVALAGKHSERCLNCDTSLLGHYCHVCGQNARTAEPSLREFCYDFFEMLTHADSKVMRTIRRLFFDPARLTRDYIKGKRASEIPPIRMFFVSLLFFFAFTSVTPFHSVITEEAAEENHFVRAPAGDADSLNAKLKSQIETVTFSGPKKVQKWLHDHLLAAVDNPDEVQHVMGEWAERIVLLLLPISAAFLWVLYAFPKPIPLYDHLIVSLHSLTVLFLVVTVAAIMDNLLPDEVMNWVTRGLALTMAVHLFSHLKGFYGRSAAGTILRMFFLALATIVACCLLTAALTIIGLQFGASGE